MGVGRRTEATGSKGIFQFGTFSLPIGGKFPRNSGGKPPSKGIFGFKAWCAEELWSRKGGVGTPWDFFPGWAPRLKRGGGLLFVCNARFLRKVYRPPKLGGTKTLVGTFYRANGADKGSIWGGEQNSALGISPQHPGADEHFVWAFTTNLGGKVQTGQGGSNTGFHTPFWFRRAIYSPKLFSLGRHCFSARTFGFPQGDRQNIYALFSALFQGGRSLNFWGARVAATMFLGRHNELLGPSKHFLAGGIHT